MMEAPQAGGTVVGVLRKWVREGVVWAGEGARTAVWVRTLGEVLYEELRGRYEGDQARVAAASYRMLYAAKEMNPEEPGGQLAWLLVEGMEKPATLLLLPLAALVCWCVDVAARVWRSTAHS